MKRQTEERIEAVLDLDTTLTPKEIDRVLDACKGQPRLGTTREVADRLKCSPRTIRRLVADGCLRPVRLSKRTVRFNMDHVERLLS
jgi:excisionase family DNA binding protein